MAARVQVRVDYRGVGIFLKSDDVGELVREAAQEVAANVAGVTTDGEYIDSDVTEYVTDRRAAVVTAIHPIAVYYQATEGILTRAAGEAGLEVRGGE